MKNWELIEKDLYKCWQDIEIRHTSVNSESELQGLCMFEIEKILNETDFTKNYFYNNSIKLLIKLNVLGYSDKKISENLKKININISENHIKQIRFVAVQKIKKKYGKELGLISIMYESFKDYF